VTTDARPERIPTIVDVASRAGVSKATASRVLAGSRDRVSHGLAARVLEAAAELHYVPNRNARALARSESDTVGLIVHDVSDPYFSEIARGVLAAAAAQDRLVVICNTYRDPAAEARYIAELRAQRVSAVMLAGSAYVEDEARATLHRQLEITIAAGTSVVVMAPHGIGRAVLPDNRGGGALAAQHLLELGHRQVAIAAGPPHLATIRNRLDGFLTLWRDAGMPEPALTYTTFDRDGGRDTVRNLAVSSPGATALFALNDLMAIGAMRELADTGRTAGADLSIIGFDDIPSACDMTPGLTTIRLPMEELGRRAFAALDDDDDRDAEVLSCELVVRGTTLPWIG
jgi:LacI family transcriptional regulator